METNKKTSLVELLKQRETFYFLFCVALMTFTTTPPIVANVLKNPIALLASSNFFP